ncbi:hypothetical protein ACFYY8_29330 [Streptosporangium sp. NPDC001559]|uniref:hypothetical protein n=1 Tax=Streptosporangium sp. NPDC001559 TaxID=3366187 RepID=UPI0036E9D5F8
MTTHQAVKDLRRALRSGKPVRIIRDIDGADRLDAYVVGLGRKWVLLHTISAGFHLDGHSVVRLRDVEHATHSGRKAVRVAHRALRLRGERPWTPPGIDLDTTTGLIDTLTKAFPLVSVHIEEIDPDVCHIGRAHGVTRKKNLRLQEISPGAAWGNACSKYRTTDITRFDVGDGYIDALHAVGGNPPDL